MTTPTTQPMEALKPERIETQEGYFQEIEPGQYEMYSPDGKRLCPGMSFKLDQAKALARVVAHSPRHPKDDSESEDNKLSDREKQDRAEGLKAKVAAMNRPATDRLREVASKTASWLRRLEVQAQRQEKSNRGRFDSLADSCAADAKNYAAVASDLERALAATPQAEAAPAISKMETTAPQAESDHIEHAPKMVAAPPVLPSDEECAREIWRCIVTDDEPYGSMSKTQRWDTAYSLARAHRTAHQAAPVRSSTSRPVYIGHSLANDTWFVRYYGFASTGEAQDFIDRITALETAKATPDAVECAREILNPYYPAGSTLEKEAAKVAALITAHTAAAVAEARVKALEDARSIAGRHGWFGEQRNQSSYWEGAFDQADKIEQAIVALKGKEGVQNA